MWPFNARKRRRVVIDPDNDPSTKTLYHAQWTEQKMPDPGAGPYAWETLGLEPYSPIGPSVRARQQIRSVSPQVYVMQGAWLDGIPITAGQVFSAPLFSEETGYTKEMPQPFSPLVGMNIPSSGNDPVPINDPFPTNLS